ncbi:CLK4-associating serine/arginine rich protein [Anabrus simplex]|uniref:CLK4-associating serine/arginine rich protein n=1 Tax=Anabrus simplex TaxID=316456 RepID=UPI0034DD3465
MWHEARKQERKIRGIMVDYKKRAERRRDFYEKIKADPTQFLQLHGRPVKIHLDPAVAMAADSPANMMPWQGRSDILIDRFDVRAHLDHIPEYPQKTDVPEGDELSREDRLANYERYRIIVQNDFLGVGEEKFLHQLYLEEQFGPVVRPLEGDKKKRNADKNPGAAIPYTYDENSAQEHGENGDEEAGGDEEKEEEEEEDDSDIDFDLCVDVTQVGPQQAHEMNLCGSAYGMSGTDFYTFLLNDIEEKESLRQAREQEEEKAMYSGRKSRRERRAFREKRLQGRKISPPSYAARLSPTYDAYRKSPSKSRSRSRSHSPINAGQITYITSFGGEEEDGAAGGGSGSVSSKSHSSAAASSHSSGLVPPQAKACRSRSPHGRSGYRYRSRGRDHSRSPSNRMRRRHDSPPRSRYRSHSRDYGSSSSRYYRNRSPHSSDHRNRSRRRRSSSSDKSSRSRSPGKLRQASRSKSPTNKPPPPPLKRYYGSRKVESSSSEFGDSDSDSKNESSSIASMGAPVAASEKKPPQNKTLSTGFGNSGAGTKPQQKLTPQERLKKKMQVLLNRQFKADKRAERMRHEKQEQERQDREDELREMAIKLRRRERERRHRMQDDDEFEEEEKGSSHSSESYSPSASPSPPRSNTSSHRRNRWDQSGDVSERPPRHRDRSRSHSPDRRSRHRPLVDY